MRQDQTWVMRQWKWEQNKNRTGIRLDVPGMDGWGLASIPAGVSNIWGCRVSRSGNTPALGRAASDALRYCQVWSLVHWGSRDTHHVENTGTVQNSEAGQDAVWEMEECSGRGRGGGGKEEGRGRKEVWGRRGEGGTGCLISAIMTFPMFNGKLPGVC